MKYLDVQKVFVFANIDGLITIMLPLDDEDKETAVNVIKYDEVAELKCGMTLTEKRILMLGDTSVIDPEEAKKIGISSKWYFTIKNYNTREGNINENGLLSIHEYTDPVQMIKLASGMLGNPKEAIILKMKYDHYIASDFYINQIKPITHNDESN